MANEIDRCARKREPDHSFHRARDDAGTNVRRILAQRRNEETRRNAKHTQREVLRLLEAVAQIFQNDRRAGHRAKNLDLAIEGRGGQEAAGPVTAAGGLDVNSENEFECPTCRRYTWVFAFLPRTASSSICRCCGF